MFISIDNAAERLGLSRTSVMNLISSGQIRRKQKTGSADVYGKDVQRVSERRRREAIIRNGDLTQLAEYARSTLRPQMAMDGQKKGRDAIRLLSSDARAIFGTDVLLAASVSTPGVCRWCWSRMSANVHETPAPEDTDAYEILLGPQCPQDQTYFAAQNSARKAENRRKNEDSARRRRQLEDLGRVANLAEGSSLIEKGRKLVASATPQTGSVRLDVASLTASANAVRDARRKQLDERIAKAVRQGQHSYARQLRTLRKAL